MTALITALLAFGLVVASVWYVPFRLSKLLGIRRGLPPYLLVGGLFLLFILYVRVLSVSESTVVGYFATLSGLLFGIHIYTTLLLLVMEVVRPLAKMSDRSSAFAAVGMSLAIVIFGFWSASSFDVVDVEVPIRGLKDDVAIMHIADVQLGHHRGKSYLEEIVRQTNHHDPDIVLITGDLVDANAALLPGVLSSLRDIQAPTFFTTGNHETYVDTDRALRTIAEHGVRILHTEMVEVKGVQIIGLDYMNADDDTFDMHPPVNNLTIKSELPKIATQDDKPIILMHHSPVGLEYVAEKGVDLMLSGHTHGGQIFPATLVASLVFPIRDGLHRRDATHIYVSPGAGTFMLPLRIGTSQQIELIRLVPVIDS